MANIPPSIVIAKKYFEDHEFRNMEFDRINRSMKIIITSEHKKFRWDKIIAYKDLENLNVSNVEDYKDRLFCYLKELLEMRAKLINMEKEMFN